jgi:hypothetical protein
MPMNEPVGGSSGKWHVHHVILSSWWPLSTSCPPDHGFMEKTRDIAILNPWGPPAQHHEDFRISGDAGRVVAPWPACRALIGPVWLLALYQFISAIDFTIFPPAVSHGGWDVAAVSVAAVLLNFFWPTIIRPGRGPAIPGRSPALLVAMTGTRRCPVSQGSVRSRRPLCRRPGSGANALIWTPASGRRWPWTSPPSWANQPSSISWAVWKSLRPAGLVTTSS